MPSDTLTDRQKLLAMMAATIYSMATAKEINVWAKGRVGTTVGAVVVNVAQGILSAVEALPAPTEALK